MEAKSPGHVRHLELRAGRIQALRHWMTARYPAEQSLTLEIGCGHGHYLTAFAQQYPLTSCLGIDLVTKRIDKAKQKRDKRGLENLDFLKAEVREFLEAWPAHLTLGRIFILFPDPWPKKRHSKNRIIQAGLLDRLSACSNAGSQLHFRTDDEANFQWGMEVVASHSRWTIRDDIDWPFENPSFFQDLLGKGQSLTAFHLE